MNKTDFFFELPPQLVAQTPLPNRTDSKLLHCELSSNQLHDLQFKDLLKQLKAGDLLVFNNSKVIPARLQGHKKTGGKVEVFIERIIDEHHAKVLIKANKAIKLQTPIYLQGQAKLITTAKKGMFQLCETIDPNDSFSQLLQQHGQMPLPPYINRQPQPNDRQRYQTVYAKTAGAVAAPTAGLHFDQQLLQQLKAQGIKQTFVTLHVGAGTFQPVKTEAIEDHQMHKEWLQVTAETCHLIEQTKAQGGRVIAVGTTAVRCLETAAQNGKLQAYQGDTQIFIYPGYQFQVIDGLITNFHLPESTLLMLVSALAGKTKILNAYHHAIKQQYRFFSYGDAMLFL